MRVVVCCACGGGVDFKRRETRERPLPLTHTRTHTTAGGSSYVAAKVNEAKDLLLGKKKPGGAGGGASPF